MSERRPRPEWRFHIIQSHIPELLDRLETLNR